MGRRVAVFGGSVALALFVAGCGSGSPSSAPKSNSDVLQVIQAAATSTSQQKSMQVRGTISMDMGAATGVATGTVSSTIAGVMETNPPLGRITLSGLSVGGQSFGTMTEMLTPDAIYMQIPMLSARTGKPWVELKFSEMKAASGFDFKQLLSQSQQMQPAQYIKQLAASGDVKAVGTDTVNGFETTHYSGTVSVQNQLSNFSGTVRTQMQSVIAKAGWTGAQIDIWLDGQGLVRRVRSSSVGGRGTFAMALDVLAYGVPVNVTPPPANQVADLAQLAGVGSLG